MVEPEVKMVGFCIYSEGRAAEFADKLDVVSERSKNDSKVFN